MKAEFAYVRVLFLRKIFMVATEKTSYTSEDENLSEIEFFAVPSDSIFVGFTVYYFISNMQYQQCI